MTSSTSDATVGVIGLGLMGSALADVLVTQGFDLRVWNRSRDKCERFAASGVPVGDSAESVASECEVLVVCLTDHAASMDVLQSGTLAKRLEGKTLVLLTTMTAEDSLVTAAWAAENGIHYLDGAILAYPREVRDMTCMIVYSGPRAVFDACKPVLDAMGGMPRLVGDEAGTAIRFASAIYTVYYAHAVGMIQGAAMCTAAGAPLDVFTELTTDYWDWPEDDVHLLDRIATRNYAVQEAALEIHATAFGTTPPLCDQLGVSSELPRVIAGLLDEALRQGYANDELPALFEVLSKPGK